MKQLKNTIMQLESLSLKTIILGLITILFFSCTNKTPDIEEPGIPSQEKVKAAILKKIEMANQKWASGNPMGFVECAANDITWMDDLEAQLPVVGKVALKSYLEGFKGKVPPHEKELTDFIFNFYDDIVIITYRYTGTFEGEPADPWKVTSVYRYIGEDWLSVHENWSEVMKKQ